MFYECQAFGQFPRAGGWHQQDDLEMYLMNIVQRAAEVYSKSELTESDAEFVVWVEDKNTDG